METSFLIKWPTWMVNLDHFQKSQQHFDMPSLRCFPNWVAPSAATSLVLRRRGLWSPQSTQRLTSALSMAEIIDQQGKPVEMWPKVSTRPIPRREAKLKGFSCRCIWLAHFNCFACLAVLLNWEFFFSFFPIVPLPQDTSSCILNSFLPKIQ